MYPVLVDVDLFGLLPDPYPLHTYGLLIAMGFVFAMKLGQRQAHLEGEDPDRVIDLAFWVLLMGLIGSRVVYIITNLGEYLRDPLEILVIWRGGLVWYGGFILAALYVAWYCRRYRLNFFKYADMFIPMVALAHGFGRLGCLAAGCCHGSPTEMPWGIVFPNFSAAHAEQQQLGLVGIGDRALPVHPTQLYEAGFEMAMFWVLTLLRPYKRFHGQLFLIWLSAYPIARSIIEVYRGDSVRGVFILSTSQFISVGVALFSAWLFFKLWRDRPKLTSAPEVEPAGAVG